MIAVKWATTKKWNVGRLKTPHNFYFSVNMTIIHYHNLGRLHMCKFTIKCFYISSTIWSLQNLTGCGGLREIHWQSISNKAGNTKSKLITTPLDGIL